MVIGRIGKTSRGILNPLPRAEIRSRQRSHVTASRPDALLPTITFALRPEWVLEEIGFAGETLVMQTAGSIHAINLNSGAELWGKEFKPQTGVRMRLKDGFVYFAESPGRISKIAVETGEIVEEVEAFSEEVREARVYTPSSDERGFRVSDSLSGETIYDFAHPNRIVLLRPSVKCGGASDYFSDNLFLYALDPASGTVRWRTLLPNSKGAASLFAGIAPVSFKIINGKIYYKVHGSIIQVLQEENGRLVKNLDLETLAELPYFAGESRLYFEEAFRTLVAFDLNRAQPLWTFQSDEFRETFGADLPLMVYRNFLLFRHASTLYALRDEAEIERLTLEDLPQPSPPEIGGMPKLSEPDFERLTKEGCVVLGERIFTLRMGPDPLHEGERDQSTVIQLDIFDAESRNHVGTFGLRVNPKSRLAEECIVPGRIDFSDGAKATLRAAGFSESYLDVNQLTELIGFKTGRIAFAKLGEAVPAGPGRELIRADEAFFRQPGAVTILRSPETCLWLDDKCSAGGLDILLASTALRLAKDKCGALGFKVKVSQKYPLIFWHAHFEAVSVYLKDWVVPLAEGADIVATAQEARFQRRLLVD